MISRAWINLSVILLVGLGMPAYYKIKYYLLGQITLEQIFTWGITADILFALSLTTVVIMGHDLVVGSLRNRFKQKTDHLKRLIIQFVVTTIHSVLAVYGFTHFFFGVLFPYAIPADTMFDFILLGLFIPILVNGIKESLYFYGEWEAESLRKEQLQKENIQARFEILRSQINPHFLFNCFNTLLELIGESKSLAMKFVHQLSYVYRFVLENREQEIIALNDELKVLESYLFLLKIRFGESLQVSYNIADCARRRSIAPMTLQILLENALKHNIATQESPLHINIAAAGRTRLTFSNKLNRKITMASTGLGLQNIINRYRYLADEEVDIRQTETDFTVSVPLLEAQPV